MVRNQMPKGLGVIPFDLSLWKESIPVDPETSSAPPSARPSLRTPSNESTKVDFRVEEGVVEIRDPRLFHAGQNPFCLAFVEEAVRPGLARRVKICLPSATCRIEFQPGQYDRDELAKMVASTLKAASLASNRRSPAFELDHDQFRWITLTAEGSNGRASISETVVEGNGQVVCRPRSAIHGSRISADSKRPVQKLARPVRSSLPKARRASVFGPKRMAEPVALAFSPDPIFNKSSSQPAPMILALRSGADSKRMVNLALAGGSFALAMAGVVLPGIPALPFLLLTGHYLVKSSPGLCESLKNVPGIGALLQKSGSAESPSIHRWSLLKMFGFSVAAVATFMILHPPLPVVIVLEAGIMAYYGIREFRKPRKVALSSPLGTRIAFVA